MMLGWLGRRRRRTASLDEVQVQLKQIQLRKKEVEVQLIRALAADPKGIMYAIGMVNPNVAKLLQAQAQSERDDPLSALALRFLEKEISRDPRKDLREMLALQRELREFSGDSEPPESENILVQLMSTPAGIELAKHAAPLVSQALATASAQFRASQATQPPTSPQATVPAAAAPELPHTPPPAPGEPPDLADLTPDTVLALLTEQPPEVLADYILAWAEQDERVAESVQRYLDASEDKIEAQLRAVLAVPGWGQVARWLCEHADTRQAIITAVRQRLAPASQPEPQPPAPSTNGTTPTPNGVPVEGLGL